jgi:quercetin dioxygenase-like cupin family protein
VKLAHAVAGAVAAAGLVASVWAQQPAFKRTMLQQVDISVPGREAVTALAEFPAGVAAGRHSHPGEEIGYVLDGQVLLEQEGKPAATLHAGQTFLIPAGAIHNATNTGSSVARVVATYIVEKGKPLATPAPAK